MRHLAEAQQQLCRCLKRPRLSVGVCSLSSSYEGQGHNGKAARNASCDVNKRLYSALITRRRAHNWVTDTNAECWNAGTITANRSRSTRRNPSTIGGKRMLSSVDLQPETNMVELQSNQAAAGLPEGASSSFRTTFPDVTPVIRKFDHPYPHLNRVVVAFGSNVGDRVMHIENALASMGAAGLRVIRLSRLYETKAMYYDKQNSFLNGVALIETELTPLELLDTLQKIELEQGRVRSIDKGPRTLDLDIILCGFDRIDHERLKVPHPLMMEREFVLRPLIDVYGRDFRFAAPLPASNHQKTAYVTSSGAALDRLEHFDASMRAITTLSPNHPFLAADDPRQPTLIMSILNITPDSFSDGGKLVPTDIDTIVTTARSHIAQGATILDVGGQSTHPKATMLPAAEELNRVLPALRAIRTIPEVACGKIAVSLDTFYSDVARPCMEEGLVDIINDISAGRLDPKMLSTVAEFQKTIVLMHMRGTPQTMVKMINYGQEGVVNMVAHELAGRVRLALTAGIPPWRIILDPGIGFAKNELQNLELLRAGTDSIAEKSCRDLSGHPWLVGTSRKGFIQRITDSPNPEDRAWGTAGCITAAIAGGARIVRVHDVKEMSKVAKMADALYRVEKESQNERKVDENSVKNMEKQDSLHRAIDDRTTSNLQSSVASMRRQGGTLQQTDADLLITLIERLREKRNDPETGLWQTRTPKLSNTFQAQEQVSDPEPAIGEARDPKAAYETVKTSMRRLQKRKTRLVRVLQKATKQQEQGEHKREKDLDRDDVDFSSGSEASTSGAQSFQEQQGTFSSDKAENSKLRAAQELHLKSKERGQVLDLGLPHKTTYIKSENRNRTASPHRNSAASPEQAEEPSDQQGRKDFEKSSGEEMMDKMPEDEASQKSGGSLSEKHMSAIKADKSREENSKDAAVDKKSLSSTPVLDGRATVFMVETRYTMSGR